MSQRRANADMAAPGSFLLYVRPGPAIQPPGPRIAPDRASFAVVFWPDLASSGPGFCVLSYNSNVYLQHSPPGALASHLSNVLRGLPPPTPGLFWGAPTLRCPSEGSGRPLQHS
jgi:hypothetical protein